MPLPPNDARDFARSSRLLQALGRVITLLFVLRARRRSPGDEADILSRQDGLFLRACREAAARTPQFHFHRPEYLSCHFSRIGPPDIDDAHFATRVELLSRRHAAAPAPVTTNHFFIDEFLRHSSFWHEAQLWRGPAILYLLPPPSGVNDAAGTHYYIFLSRSNTSLRLHDATDRFAVSFPRMTAAMRVRLTLFDALLHLYLAHILLCRRLLYFINYIGRISFGHFNLLHILIYESINEL